MIDHKCVSDGMVYTSYPPQYKCKICGRYAYIHENKIGVEPPDWSEFKTN